MSSRFVSAGTNHDPTSNKDDWEKARQEVENQRVMKPVQPGKEDDGRSLYEVLEANKAAKQEAFEEATKLRNQFRPLDDSEVEFLDSVRQTERAKEDRLRRETAEQLDVFRKSKVEAEQAAADLQRETVVAEQAASEGLWIASKKRRRDRGEEDMPSAKLRQSSQSKDDKQCTTYRPTGSAEKPIPTSDQGSGLSSEPKAHGKITSERGVPTGSGLVAYDSDDEDDD